MATRSTITARDRVKTLLPASSRRWLRRQPLRLQRLLLGDSVLLRRTSPIDPHWGGRRGQIVDRFYIERFLAEHAPDIRGHVLEFGDDAYTRRFGGQRVDKIDLLDLTRNNPRATIVADLANAGHVPSDTFDCIVCTQVLLLVYDLRAAVRTLHRILKPGGVLLLTAPGIQKISRGDMEIGGEYWRFTTLSLRRLFGEVFPPEMVETKASGNVLAATAFLLGLAVEDVGRGGLEENDPDFELSIAVRARKPKQEDRGRLQVESSG
jgi:SAM-dependent methyltransferase